MHLKRPKSIEKPVLVGVIFVNIIVLYFVYQRLTQKVQANTPFKYGDFAPVLEGITTIDGDQVEIPDKEKKLTVLLFFGPSHEIPLREINEMVISEGFIDKGVQFLGVFDGHEDGEKTSIEMVIPVIVDFTGRIYRHFRFSHSAGSSAGILALDANSKVKLNLHGLIKPEYLKDFLHRNISNEI